MWTIQEVDNFNFWIGERGGEGVEGGFFGVLGVGEGIWKENRVLGGS
jgi:hypothetical protein